MWLSFQVTKVSETVITYCQKMFRWNVPQVPKEYLPDSYEVQTADVEADSGGETEAGTMVFEDCRSSGIKLV